MKTPRRRSLLTVLGVSAAAAVALPVVAATVSGAPAPPDLVAQPAGAPKAQLYKDGRLLVRFDGYIPNAAGAGPLEIRASNPNAQDVMQNVGQYAVPVNDPGEGNTLLSTGRAPRVQFEAADDHNHYHLKNAAEYTLRTPDGAGQVALAQKTEAGFCLEDSQDLAGNPMDGPYSASDASVGGNNFCWQDHQTTGPVLIMGISPGFRDVYGEWLSYQWVDVSSVQPGNYKLGSRVDPDNVIVESNESNNGYALRDAVVPGYVAASKTVGLAPSVPVTLDATKFTATDYPTDGNGEAAGNPGTRRFRIVAGPRHGSLNVAVGTELTGSPTVVYTPAPGSNLTDSFQYVAYYRATADDGVTRTYPANPAPATVTVAGATPSVALNGAPASVIAGTSVQLSAAVVNAPSGVTWSATGGTVSPTGLFTAPAAPGSVTVRATSVDEPSISAAATIAVVAGPPKKPAGSSLLTAGNKRLSPLRITRSNRLVVAKVATGGKAGTVTFTAAYGRLVLAHRTFRVGARKTVTFKVRLRPGLNPKKVRITAKFTSGRITAVRRSFVR